MERERIIFITREEAMEIMNISYTAFFKLKKDGLIPEGYKILDNKRYFYFLPDIIESKKEWDEILRKRKIKPEPKPYVLNFKAKYKPKKRRGKRKKLRKVMND